ncbi:MAG: phosphoglucosamine mutase [Proteobacteria bacterium]|nr:phosphoglucosamine mutase [Pseudomonadota bacterium]
MTRQLFGTDGVRGKANAGIMTPELAFRIGAAITYLARRSTHHPPRAVIGKDTRISGYLFETALASGICAMGGRVMLTGPLPTPAIAHIAMSMRADLGIVVSASHNPFHDNGIKIFGRDGFKLPDETEQEIERLVESDVIDRKRPTGIRVGRAERIEGAWGRYVAFAKATFPQHLTLDGVEMVIDAAHGAAYLTAPSVFSELGATVHAIGVRPNGRNINAKCGATHPETCAREVKKRQADLGIALDGDADRVIVIDDQGDEVDGDAIMALCAGRMLRKGTLKQGTLVATVMSNLGLEHALEQYGGKLVRCPVGDRYVVETMRSGGYNFGGEQSGHLVFLDHATTGDGTVAALQLLSILLQEQRPLSELAQMAMARVPQVQINVRLPRRRPLDEMTGTCSTIRGVEQRLGKDGRVVVRWSGTEPKLRVMVEGPDATRIADMAQTISSAAQKEVRG